MGLPETLRLNVRDGLDGKCSFDLTVEDIHLNTEGFLHGGVISTMVDMAMGRAIRSVVPEDMEIMTVGLNVSFFGAVKQGVVNVEAHTTFVGKRLVHGEADITSGDRLLAHATGTWYARPR